MKGLILAGGHGTRLRPITFTVQKQLVPIANRPIIFYCIDDLVEAGIKDIGIIVGPNKEQVKETVGKGSKWGKDVKITYIEQDSPKGLAHCIIIAKKFLGDDSFVMYLGDNILKDGIKGFVDKFKKSKCSASLMLTRVPNPEAYGVALIDEQNKVVKKLVEKPKNPPSNLTIVGVYGFNKNIFTAVDKIEPSWRNELEITDAIQWLLENNFPIEYHEVQGWWKDTGNAKALLAANTLILDRSIHIAEGTDENLISENHEGRIHIGDNCEISGKAHLKGPLIIGNNVKIGDNVYIGPHTSIGNNAHIESGDIGNCIIMDDVSINIDDRIVDSVIGRGVNIKSKKEVPKGKTLVIGDNSIVLL